MSVAVHDTGTYTGISEQLQLAQISLIVVEGLLLTFSPAGDCMCTNI